MTASPRHSVSVGAAVVRADGRNLGHPTSRQWQPPGGILDLGESIDEGLSREVSEETGLLVEIDHLTGVYKNMARA